MVDPQMAAGHAPKKHTSWVAVLVSFVRAIDMVVRMYCHILIGFFSFPSGLLM